MEGHVPPRGRAARVGLRRPLDDTDRATVKKGPDAEHASRPTLAVDAMAHRHAAWFSLAAKLEPTTGATCETLIHRYPPSANVSDRHRGTDDHSPRQARMKPKRRAPRPVRLKDD